LLLSFSPLAPSPSASTRATSSSHARLIFTIARHQPAVVSWTSSVCPPLRTRTSFELRRPLGAVAACSVRVCPSALARRIT
jgi:hypothetical protein